MADIQRRCPNCYFPGPEVFYRVRRVPVFSVRLLHTRESALDCPRGDIELAVCRSCGFIWNIAFNPETSPYSSGYEATQSYSPTFDAFARNLAGSLVERHDLLGKQVIEIGCGMGEFLVLLAELGANSCTGFDPAYLPGRVREPEAGRVSFVADFYSEKYASTPADAIICKMTLEHIPETREFLKMIRRTIGNRPKTLVFFQIPDVTRILNELAFWDVYYEHCSYFCPASLTRLFTDSGFLSQRISTDYDGQYLLIEAVATCEVPVPGGHPEEQPAEILERVRRFASSIGQTIESVRRFFVARHEAGLKSVLWGGGSKAVAFLTTLGLTHEVDCCVDINPYKEGTFVAGTGQVIIPPAQLPARRPDTVIAMNPIYRAEIARQLSALGLKPQLLTVNDLQSQPARPLELD